MATDLARKWWLLVLRGAGILFAIMAVMWLGATLAVLVEQWLAPMCSLARGRVLKCCHTIISFKNLVFLFGRIPLLWPCRRPVVPRWPRAVASCGTPLPHRIGRLFNQLERADARLDDLPIIVKAEDVDGGEVGCLDVGMRADEIAFGDRTIDLKLVPACGFVELLLTHLFRSLPAS